MVMSRSDGSQTDLLGAGGVSHAGLAVENGEGESEAGESGAARGVAHAALTGETVGAGAVVA